MGKNRKRAPIYQYLSKQQYLLSKNIPKEVPLPSIRQENHAYHHATLITINPFSREKLQKTTHFAVLGHKANENTEEILKNIKTPSENPYEHQQKPPQNSEFLLQESQNLSIYSSKNDKPPTNSLPNSLPALHKSQFQPPNTTKSPNISPKALHHSLIQSPHQNFSSPNKSTNRTPSQKTAKTPENNEYFPNNNEGFPNNNEGFPNKIEDFPNNNEVFPNNNSTNNSLLPNFSSSPKARLQTLEKTSSDLPSLIETLPEYQRSFNKKSPSPSLFEVKAQVLELQDALSQQKELYSSLYNTYSQKKANEEVLEARLLAYKESFEGLSQTIEEIKELQEKLSEHVEKAQNCEFLIKNLEDEALEIMLKDLKAKENDVEALKAELSRVKSRRLEEDSCREKLMENIRELEREIVELQALKTRDPTSSPFSKEQEFSRTASPLPKSSEKTDLLRTLETFFDSKVQSFEILLKKPVF